MVHSDIKSPELIHQTTSDYNERIEVFQTEKTRSLSVNGTVQSINWDAPSCKKRVWGQLVELVKKERSEAKYILLFGLGGGTMVHLFSRELPNVRVVAVEIDKVMIDVAKQFFDIDSLSNLSVINADALRVVSEPEKFDLHKDTFDVVIIDIYCGDQYPDLGRSRTFFSGIKWFLRIGGLAIFNRIYIQDHQNEADAFCDLVKEVYANVGTKSVAGRTNSDNRLIYGEVA
jgi:spermidine synthase